MREKSRDPKKRAFFFSYTGTERVTFSVSTEADECVSYFHQQVVGTFPRPGGHLFSAYDDLEDTTTTSSQVRHQRGDWPACGGASLYLWQQVGDELFVLGV